MMRPRVQPEPAAEARRVSPDGAGEAGARRRRSHKRTRRVVLRVALVAVLLTLSPGRLLTQEVTGPALKAAFLFNFVKFTTWPPDVLPEGAPLQMCVVNAEAVGGALSAAVQGRVVVGHAIHVAEPTDGASLRGCHVLFVSGPRAAALKVVADVRDAPVLTVSDLQGFTAEGGVAQFHLQQGQLRFAFGRDAARTARLQISSKLLTLARQP
jgi:hypothetical protein